jgi:arsenic resistance protein ArsH
MFSYHTEPKLYSHGEQAVQRMRETRGSRLMPGGNRDRLVDCMEFVKYSIVMRPHFDLFSDRYSERTERMVKRVNMEGKPGANPIM